MNGPKRYEKAVVLSLRAEHVPALLSGAKKAEYRKRFPPSYEGRIFVYECSPRSRHKVVGVFETRGCAQVHPRLMRSATLRERLLDACELAGIPDAEFEELLEMSPDEPTVTVIPVLRPRRLEPTTPAEFTRIYDARPEFLRAPMSWTETTVLAQESPAPETPDADTGTTVQADLFGPDGETERRKARRTCSARRNET